MFVKKVPNLSYIEKIRVVNQLQTQSSSNTSLSAIQPTNTTITSTSNNNTSKQSSNKPTSSLSNMLLTRTYNNTTNNYHYGHYMPHKTTSNKTSNVQLMDHPNIPPYLLAMAKNSQIVQHEKESERVNAFQKLNIQTPTTTLQTNYSSSSLNVLAQSPCSPSSMLDSSPTPNTKSDSKSVKRFIAHSQTHNLIQRNDLVFINIDEELSILNMIDPLFHGKIGIISEIREDDCVIEVVENNQKNNDDNMCFMNMTVNQPISHSFQPQSMLGKELNKSSRPSVRPLKRKIVVPIFCLCLEDTVLKERLANNNGYQR